MAASSKQTDPNKPAFSKRRALFLGKDSDSIIKTFFGSNAMVAIVILALITIFLFKEGAGFMGLYHKSLEEYRLSGLEYVDILKEKREDYTELTRYLNDVKSDWINELKASGSSQAEISKAIFNPEAKALFLGYMRAGSDLKKFVKTKMDVAIEIRDQHTTNENLRETVENYTQRIAEIQSTSYTFSKEDRAKYTLLLRDHSRDNSLPSEEAQRFLKEADSITPEKALDQADRETFAMLLGLEAEKIEATIKPVDFNTTIKGVIDEQARYAEILDALEVSLTEVVATADAVQFNSPAIEERIATFKELNQKFFSNIDAHKAKLANWDQSAPVSIFQAASAFLTGKDWVTASDQQDWYGLMPLLSGSLLISAIALVFAIPFGVGAAIYVNQIAGPAERNFIKPYVEFISAIPSVVIGFFGVVVFGEFIRWFSQLDGFQWVPFFPIQERLNAFTAGCLLALMAIPTIFTLAEDAINNIPRHFKEASLAMGATPLQTTMRVIVPTALSGIISAIMLGFGRVIGETMVVLLCAGNRIKIPDFTEGPGVFFEPVHTMTGIIAQEMGEVVQGSLHYRALFMVGIVLFFISLIINYTAQWVVKRFSKLGD
ncbi:MAG: phosphate ABC transporter permease subunit PstC [Opitutales bacterium]|jgi:phosphate transport system permease protein|nr:phosphate ABC transporter permease subunit PstC [Opitutales bacterium]MDP4644672.1 phosphate ABC transporter permease subunit PstC [Opitutales bacterium]MDP4777521.1 phosphate ABC transporter permease subunit PstC [Opitutales bacterium]MDP4884308.1 phosphate ABC transporter permease subunit PstC [Opitutales bacterium]MDP5080177.1 phosphate ABC transporter permease subunit PstC [Opitutales bacterium]